ncbi:MG2 domain-containing protein [uncultured Mucilaginibacter sp.]|uniref:MG2 domain-containing protein n=1 Tax=uncultured Mucilaginibacter sp. TaxID=797541 RepID=UPI0025F0E8BB|nr:MG2 domain-containing protein [uncultured Mucilaginibacter sp.]
MKRCFLVVVIIACAFNLKAQNKPAFKLFFEKAYLHTDRNLYAQGDTLWFKAYLVNAQNNQPIGTSGNLYVDLIEQDSAKVVTSEIIRLDYGTGNGDISLSDSIPTGKYTLRAYTNWMRNFGDNFVFEKEITILNTSIKKTDTIAVNNKSGSKQSKVIPTKIRAINHIPIARFYPESGSLITGISSIVAVKTENIFGKGIPVKGAVLSSAGDTVAHFNCDTLGMGLFVLLPIQGQSYHAIISTKNQQGLNADLQQSLTKGFAIRINHGDSTTSVIISCNDAELAEAKGHSFTLAGKHGGKTYFSQSIQITDIQSLIRIDNSLLPDGITAITLTDDQGKPHSERLIYISHKSTPLSITTDKTQYQSKEKVTVNIKTNAGKVSLSMAVVDAGIVPVQSENIESYLMLQSELRGEIEQPNRYFDTTNINRSKQLDMLLLTQGWRDFIWRRLADTAIRISYKAEDGIDITGKVKNGKSDKPMPGLNVTLYASASKGAKLFSYTTEPDGSFSFLGLPFYGQHPARLSSVNAKGEKLGTFFMDTLTTLPVRPVADVVDAEAPADIPANVLTAIIKRQSAITEASLKGTKTLKTVTIRASKTTVLKSGIPLTSWGPDQVFDITSKDYHYKTLEWYMLQHVKGAEQSKEDAVTGVVIPCIDTFKYYTNAPFGPQILYRPKMKLLPPQFVINGVDYTTDHFDEAESYRAIYYPLSIDKFKRIVVKHFICNLVNAHDQTTIDPGLDAQVGQITVDRYIIYLTLKEDALIGYNPGTSMPVINGYYQARTFYKPLYDTPKDQTKPDLRTTIHWEPNIITDTKGEATVSFYNADPKTTVRIIVEGVKATGGALSATATYLVK